MPKAAAAQARAKASGQKTFTPDEPKAAKAMKKGGKR
jgi:hypothetical protein